MPKSVKMSVLRAPASSKARMSRRRETPVALNASTVEAAMPHARDDGRRGRGLAGFHAGARQCDHRHALRVELGLRIELAIADAGRHADALAEIGEIAARRR